MGRESRLGLMEFLSDIRGVVTAPGRRFPIIHERGAAWGSLVIMLLPAYFGFSFAGALGFRRDPFPGYSFLMPALLAAFLTFLKLFSIHLVARALEPKNEATPGTFRGLTVVYGYAGIPAFVAPILAVAVFLAIPGQMGTMLHSFRAVTISILIAVGIALFVWNVILMVLGLRLVYRIRDLKILVSIFAGPLVIGVLTGFASNNLFQEFKTRVACMRPVLSDRMLRFATADLSGESMEQATVSAHMDRLSYRLGSPERFDIVAYAGSLNSDEAAKKGAEVQLVGRIVGIPGDSVALVGGRLRVNGQLWAEPYIPPGYQSAASVPETRLAPSDYLVFPEDRRLVDSHHGEFVVARGRIRGRVMINKWPLGWWWFHPSAFLQPYAVPE